MRSIPHWNRPTTVRVAESVGGVLATLDPFDNLARGDVLPWPPPKVVQKLYASRQWKGKATEDDQAATNRLGYYCDLQSLNSEDAITWSFFGPLVYGRAERRAEVARSLLAGLGEQVAEGPVSIWLWRRVPHPEKPGSTGGPEIDFGIQVAGLLILGEAKWNSDVGRRQGVNRDRTQLDLRRAYCSGLGLRNLPDVRRWIILGVSRTGDPLEDVTPDEEPDGPRMHNLSWSQLTNFMPTHQQPDLRAYLRWKEEYSSPMPKKRVQQNGGSAHNTLHSQ